MRLRASACCVLQPDMPSLHQLLSGYADGDAISHCARVLRAHLRAMGWSSEIYVEEGRCSPALRGDCLPLDRCRPRADDVVLYHYSIASAAQAIYQHANGRKVLLYHNITPAEYFDAFDPSLATRLREARASLPSVVRNSEACWADSQFNARELEAAGARSARVFPLVFDPAPLNVPVDQQVADKFKARLTNLLFVGRIVPNKKIETLIEAFCWYNKTINPFSRLILVGSAASCPRYYAMLRMLAGDFDLPNVCFEGFASPGGLPTYYRQADVFVTTSEHEGYCLPLVEAMHMNVPVIAHAIGGMPEAMSGAGVLYRDLSAADLACLIDRVITDIPAREKILASQKARMDEIARRDIAAEISALLGALQSAGTSLQML